MAAALKRSNLLKFSSIAAVWVVLIAVGRAVRPSESGAAVARPQAQGAHTARSSEPPSDSAVVGTLAGKTYRVTLRVTSEGPRYDVAGADGAPIARMLDLTALGATFPDIDVRSLTASPDSVRVMSAEGRNNEQ